MLQSRGETAVCLTLIFIISERLHVYVLQDVFVSCQRALLPTTIQSAPLPYADY